MAIKIEEILMVIIGILSLMILYNIMNGGSVDILEGSKWRELSVKSGTCDVPCSGEICKDLDLVHQPHGTPKWCFDLVKTGEKKYAVPGDFSSRSIKCADSGYKYNENQKKEPCCDLTKCPRDYIDAKIKVNPVTLDDSQAHR